MYLGVCCSRGTTLSECNFEMETRMYVLHNCKKIHVNLTLFHVYSTGQMYAALTMLRDINLNGKHFKLKA